MYFAEDNRALLLHCASLCVHASMWTLRQCSRSGELSIFWKLKSIESETEIEIKETRSYRTSCTFCCPEISGPCICMRVMRGSVWSLRSTRSGQKKSTGLEKRRRLKDSGRSPDTYIYNYIYIASDRIPSQHVGVGLAQARPNNRCIITSDAHSLRSDPALLLTAWDYP